MLKTNYLSSIKKRIVQAVVFQGIKESGYKKLVGLAGPNISNYLQFVKKLGIKKAEIYENNKTQLILQMSDFNPAIPTTVKFADILEAPVSHETLYDLDFCCSITYASKHIRKFKNSGVIITLSVRPVGLKKTINKFCKLISKEKPTIQYDTEITDDYKVHTITFPGEKSYQCYQYCDSSPMLTIKPNF